jgi:hypothetical protein
LIEDPKSFVNRIVQLLFNRKIIEKTSRDEDVALAGLLDFLGCSLSRFSKVRQQLENKMKIVEYLTHHGLFNKEKPTAKVGGEEVSPPLCKHPNTRQACLELLRVLCIDELSDKLFVTQYLRQNVTNEVDWRTPRKADWHKAATQ